MVMMAGGQDRYARFMVSHRGTIQRSSQGGLRKYKYIDGLNKIIRVSRSISLQEFHDQLAVIAGGHKVAVRYVCPHDKQHAIRDVVTADDLRRLLDSVLLRDLLIELRKEFVPHVRVFVDRVDDVRPPLPESLFSSAPTTETTAPPSCLNKRSASAPSLSANSADDPSNPPSPSLLQRSASASTLTQASPEEHTTTTTQGEGGIAHYAAPPYLALHRGPVGPAPLFLIPVGPVMMYQHGYWYQQVIPVYQGFPVPAGCPGGSAVHHLE